MPYASKEKQAEYWKKYFQKNKGRILETKREWVKRTPEKQAVYRRAQKARVAADPEKYRTYFRARHILKTYGLTSEQFEAMLQAQDGKCAICGRLPNGTNHVEQTLVIDHCHATNKVRGLLCNNCNSGMGMIGDTVEHLKAALAYLKSFQGG